MHNIGRSLFIRSNANNILLRMKSSVDSNWTQGGLAVLYR